MSEWTSTVGYTGQLGTECKHLKSGNIICTDAPVDNKGKGEAFSPTDLVATALASCMITVMGIRAAKSNIPFSRVKAKVVKVMSSEPRRIDEVHITIHIDENWSDEEKVLLEKVGRTCPVALSLHSDVIQHIDFYYG